MWVVFYYSEDLSCEKPAFKKKKKREKKGFNLRLHAYITA